MRHYHNEHDPKAAAWLRELMRRGHIPEGWVDERSICDVRPDDLRGFVQCHFFAGIGGWSLALRLAGWPDDRPVWTGSCPCQPFSSAGKGLGEKDARHLWPVFFGLIRERRPEQVFGEQVAGAVGKGWLDGVSADLEREGYACGAAVLGAHSVGAPNIRQRLYWLGDADGAGREQHGRAVAVRAAHPAAEHGGPSGFWSDFDLLPCTDGKARRVEPGTFPLAHGVPGRVGLLRGYGNAINPWCAREFIQAWQESKR